ncbi:MAG: hypothetical protein ACK41D_12460 [Rubricoccaceae bacterium]
MRPDDARSPAPPEAAPGAVPPVPPPASGAAPEPASEPAPEAAPPTGEPAETPAGEPAETPAGEPAETPAAAPLASYEPVPAALTAWERVQARPAAPPRDALLSWRSFALLGLLVLGLYLAYAFIHRDAAPGEVDLLSQVVQVAETLEPERAVGSREAADAYVLETYNWPLRVPDLGALRVFGAGTATLAPAVEVPVVFYRDEAGRRAVLFAYDYVLLDAAQDRLTLLPAVYARLAEAEPVDTRRLGDAFLVSWRERAVIFTAVTTSEEVFEAVTQQVRAAVTP